METPETLTARNVAELRKARGLTVRELSVRLAELGRPILASGITKLENGGRRVDVGDLIALALALNVSPLALLLPLDWPDDAVIELTSAVQAENINAWRWATGVSALPDDLGDEPNQEQQEAYERLSLSKRLRYLKNRPASRSAEELRRDVDRVVELSQFAVSGDQEFGRRLAMARASLARLAAELDRVELEHAELERGLEEFGSQRMTADAS